MSDLWMRQYTDNIASLQKPTGSAGQHQTDLTVKHRFVLIYWDSDDEPAVICNVTECPEWPTWRISTWPQLFELGTDITQVDVYSQKHCIWMRDQIDNGHTVATDSSILMRRRGISGSDEQEQIDRFVSSSLQQHLRHNMPAECDAVRRALRLKRQRQLSAESASDDLEILAVPLPPKRYTQRPRLTIDTQSSPDIGPSSSSSTSTSTPSSSLPSPTSPALVSPASSTSSLTPLLWPAGVHAVDMAKGFIRMDSPALKGVPMPARFDLVFGAPYRSSTYHDQRKRWRLATEDQRQAVLNAGHTPLGLWSTFAISVPLK